MKKKLIRFFLFFVKIKNRKWKKNAIKIQNRTLLALTQKAQKTDFGKRHKFSEIYDYESFKSRVPLREYEDFKEFLFKNNVKNKTWIGSPIYYCKTSGTTSGVKFIPISKHSLSNHINSARAAILNYMIKASKTSLINGKMMFIQGMPTLDFHYQVPSGRLSGIVAHHVPFYLRNKRLPSYKINSTENWLEKMEGIIFETHNQNMTLIGGIPPWLIMYFEKLIKKTNKKTVLEIFPNLELLVVGGMNFAPYAERFKALLGGEVQIIEVYAASEGFFAYQDQLEIPELLLLIDEGIFYEFINTKTYYSGKPERISIEDIKLGENYALVVNSNAGLWGYIIGDTIRFTSKDPYRIVITGRLNQFISAFGEHLIIEEAEKAVSILNQNSGAFIKEFHVAPKFINDSGGLPYHEWFIEFDKHPRDIKQYELKLDMLLQEQNIYYKDLISSETLQTLKITILRNESFNNYMEDKGKLGGQNKMIRLSNNRDVANEILKFAL